MSQDAKTISLKHWLEYIQTIHAKPVDFDLSRVREVARVHELDNLNCKVIVVGGTNGKGSTVALLSKILRKAGLNVGSYFSPHLVYFNERIVLNGVPCPEPLLCEAFGKIEKARKKTPLTFFEFTTLAAFEIFKNHPLDVVILEVGCGGEKDAVNLVSADLSIITSVGLEHTEWLGKDVETIGRTKAGIFRQNKPVILGKKANLQSILDTAESLQAPVYLEGRDFDWKDTENSHWEGFGMTLRIPPNAIPSTSVSICLAALELLKGILPNCDIPYQNLNQILRTAQMPGRFQKVLGRVETILDVAHNPDGAEWLQETLLKRHDGKRLMAVWSSLADKDLEGIVAPLKDLVDTWFIAPIQAERAASIESLEKALKHHEVQHYQVSESLYEAYKLAERKAKKDDHILVFGSFYTVGEVLRNLESALVGNNFYQSEVLQKSMVE